MRALAAFPSLCRRLLRDLGSLFLRQRRCAGLPALPPKLGSSAHRLRRRFITLACRDPHDVDRVADHISGASLALWAFGHGYFFALRPGFGRGLARLGRAAIFAAASIICARSSLPSCADATARADKTSPLKNRTANGGNSLDGASYTTPYIPAILSAPLLAAKHIGNEDGSRTPRQGARISN
jgi:hypothetical protein